MAKFEISVTVKAEYSYTVVVDSDSEAKAEHKAVGLWRDNMPDDFQVEKGYVTNWETDVEQQTADCPECGVEHRIPAFFDKDICHCGAITDGYSGCNPHISTDGSCIAPPWGLQDQEYCFACDAKLSAEFLAEQK